MINCGKLERRVNSERRWLGPTVLTVTGPIHQRVREVPAHYFSRLRLARYQCNGLGGPHAGAGIAQGFKPFGLHDGEHLDSFQDFAQ